MKGKEIDLKKVVDKAKVHKKMSVIQANQARRRQLMSAPKCQTAKTEMMKNIFL